MIIHNPTGTTSHDEVLYTFMNNIQKVEHIWNEKSNRWIYVERNIASEIIGVNFMQGNDPNDFKQGNDYNDFKRHWCITHAGLTRFHNYMKEAFKLEANNYMQVTFLNMCIDTYIKARSQR